MAWFNAGLSSNSGGASSFNELDDVAINTQTLSNGQVPVYNSTTHKWENGEQSGGASSFNELDDVSINTQTLSNGQVPVYNSTTHKWENGEQSGGSSGHNYSENEQVVGTWVDGNTLYEKTISFTTTNNSNYIQQPVGLLKAEIDKVWVVDGFTYKDSIYSSVMPYAYTNNTVADDQFEGFINKSSTNVTFDYRVGKDLYEAPAYVTIRYTKSST